MDILSVEKIKEEGFRITKIRKSIALILHDARKPMAVQEITSGLHKKDLSPNKTTIYRQLEFLKKLNLINEVDFGDGKKRYEANRGKHHHHIVCVNCGRVEDVELKADLSLDELRIQKKTGFKIIEHAIELFGLCPPCSPRGEAGRRGR